MKLYHGLEDLRHRGSPIVLAAGFFDGIHRGHLRVLNSTIKSARREHAEAWALTFDTHPLKVLDPDRAPLLLTSNHHKAVLLRRLQLDACLLLHFSREVARMEPPAFVQRLTAALPGLKQIVVGQNWRFGRKGSGTPALLEALGKQKGFRVHEVEALTLGGKPVSSTRIRRHVARGELDAAATLLGRYFSVMGQVIRGRGIGRTLGFPTANLKTENEVLPPPGVYAALVVPTPPASPDRPPPVFHAVVNYGIRPTFDNGADKAPSLELHLMEAVGDLYGKQLEAFFVNYIRPERRFRDAQELAAQLHRDAAEARAILSTKKVKECLYSPLRPYYSHAEIDTEKNREG